MNDTPARSGSIDPLSAVLGEVGERFSRLGALGLLVVDAASLVEIESRYGHAAHQSALATLGDLVSNACKELFDSGDQILAAGEIGRSEIALFLPREYQVWPAIAAIPHATGAYFQSLICAMNTTGT